MCIYWRGNYCERVDGKVGKLNLWNKNRRRFLLGRCVHQTRFELLEGFAKGLRSEIEHKSFLFVEICIRDLQ